MDMTSGVQDVNLTITPAPSLAITVAADTTISMPITGVGGLKGDKGDAPIKGVDYFDGAPGTTDYNALTNKPTLGTAATTAATDYATSAQGAKADTAVQPATLTSGLNTKANTSHTHSQADVSSLVSDLAAKQDTLVSGTNIKTINGSSLLGSGDLAIAGGGGSGTVTSVTSANTDATVATSTTTPVITIVSAPKLTTARTINGVSFDGTANITVADSTKEPTVTAGTTAQYYRGDKSWQTLDKTSVGLGNVDNTSDASKPVSTATQTALNAKLPVSGTTTGDIFVDYIGGKTDANVDFDLNANFLGTLSVGSAAVPTVSSTSSLTNKTLIDSTTFIADDVDNTKRITFQVSGQGTGTTNTISFPNGSSMVVVGTSSTQTLTNKTLTAPVINNPTGFLTGAAKITVGTSTPASPTTGDLWIDTN